MKVPSHPQIPVAPMANIGCCPVQGRPAAQAQHGPANGAALVSVNRVLTVAQDTCRDFENSDSCTEGKDVSI